MLGRLLHSRRRAESEQLWGDFERRLGYLYSALSSDELLDNQRAMNTVRAILALHAARSYTVAQVGEMATRWSKERVARELVINQPVDLAAQIRSRTPYEVPITPSLLIEEARRAVERNSGAFVPGGPAFRDRLYVHFRTARHHLKENGPGIELIVPADPKSEFLISDDPVLLPSRERDGRLGPREGVGLLEAETFAMPFSPRHVLAVGPVNRRIEVDHETVERFNAAQVRSAHVHVVARPGSGLAEWAVIARGMAPAVGKGRIGAES